MGRVCLEAFGKYRDLFSGALATGSWSDFVANSIGILTASGCHYPPIAEPLSEKAASLAPKAVES